MVFAKYLLLICTWYAPLSWKQRNAYASTWILHGSYISVQECMYIHTWVPKRLNIFFNKLFQVLRLWVRPTEWLIRNSNSIQSARVFVKNHLELSVFQVRRLWVRPTEWLIRHSKSIQSARVFVKNHLELSAIYSACVQHYTRWVYVLHPSFLCEIKSLYNPPFSPQ